MADAEQVLAEMAELGLHGTELGAIGFLPQDPSHLRKLLERHSLQLVGGFVPLVLHEPRADNAMELARQAAALFAAAGGTILVLALVNDMNWSAPATLDDDGWRRLAEHVDELQALAAEHGVTVALHPHAGTLIESAEQVQRALSELDVGWCLDTGHLLIGGVDPAEFARAHGDRVVHVHLKDVDGALAARTRSGAHSLLEATKRNLFLPLGQGDARIGDVLRALDAYHYDGWLVFEQDTALAAEPRAPTKPHAPTEPHTPTQPRAPTESGSATKPGAATEPRAPTSDPKTDAEASLSFLREALASAPRATPSQP
jgi:inosose dehydratase